MSIADEFSTWAKVGEGTETKAESSLFQFPKNAVTDAIGGFVDKAKANWDAATKAEAIRNDLALANSDMYYGTNDLEAEAGRTERKLIKETVAPPVYATAMAAGALGATVPVVTGLAGALFVSDIMTQLKANTKSAMGSKEPKGAANFVLENGIPLYDQLPKGVRDVASGVGETLLDFTPFYRLGEQIASDPAKYVQEVKAQPAEASWDIGMNLLATFLIGRGFTSKKGASAADIVKDAKADPSLDIKLSPDEIALLERIEKGGRYTEADLTPATQAEMQQALKDVVVKIAQEKWDKAERTTLEPHPELADQFKFWQENATRAEAGKVDLITRQVLDENGLQPRIPKNTPEQVLAGIRQRQGRSMFDRAEAGKVDVITRSVRDMNPYEKWWYDNAERMPERRTPPPESLIDFVDYRDVVQAETNAPTASIVQELSTRRNGLIKDMIKDLKASIQGVEKVRISENDPSMGETTTALFNQSQNPKWYSDFWKDNKRAPTGADYRAIAEDALNRGIDLLGDRIMPNEHFKAINQTIDALKKAEIAPDIIKPESTANAAEAANMLANYHSEGGKLYGGLSGLDELGKRFFGKAATGAGEQAKVKARPAEVNRVVDSISETKPPSFSDRIAETVSKLAENWLDDKTDIRTIDKLMEQEKGRPLTADEKMYNAIHLAAPKANAEINLLLYGKMNDLKPMPADSVKAIQAIRNNRPGIKLQDVTLKDVFDRLKTAEDKQMLDAYSIAKQAIDALREHPELKLPNNLTVADFTATINHIDSAMPHIAEAHANAMKVKQNMMELNVADQIVSRETANMLQTKYPNHVPMYRDMIGTILDGHYAKNGGFFNVPETIRAYSGGSERNFLPPLESLVMNLVRERSIGNRNAAAVKIIEMANDHPWIAQMEGVNTSTGEPIQVAGNYRSSNPEVKSFNVKIGGERFSFSTSPELFDAIQSMEPMAQNLLAKILNVPYSMLKAGATGLNPEFMIRNPIRDTGFAAVTSDNFTPGVTTAKGLKSAITGSQSMYDYYAGGGGMDTMLFADRMSIAQKSRDMILGKGVGHYLGAATDLLGTLGNYSEIASRLGAYESTLAKTGDRTAAAMAGRTSTVDFLVAGKIGRQVNQVIPFFNAAIQGGAKMVSYAKANPAAFTAKGIAYITVPTLILKALFGDHDAIKDRPDWEKDMYWMFPVGDTIVKINKPPGLGYVFGTLPERMLDMAIKQDPAMAGKILNAFWRDVAPPIGLPGAQQFAEWKSNYNFFRDAPIVSRKYEGLPAELQYDQYTSEVGKFVGKAFEVSPMKVDNTIRGMTAGLGKIVSDVADIGIRATKDSDTSPAKKWQEYPLARAIFTTKGSASQSTKDFWDRYTELSEKYSASQKKLGTITNKEKTEYANLHKVAKKIQDLNKREAVVQKQNISKEEKRKKLDELRNQYQELTLKAVSGK